MCGPRGANLLRTGVAEQLTDRRDGCRQRIHSATAPSHAGICDGQTKVLAIIVSGNSSPNTSPAPSWLTISPRKIPMQIIANRSRSSSPNAARAAASPRCGLQPTSRPQPTSTTRCEHAADARIDVGEGRGTVPRPSTHALPRAHRASGDRNRRRRGSGCAVHATYRNGPWGTARCRSIATFPARPN